MAFFKINFQQYVEKKISKFLRFFVVQIHLFYNLASGNFGRKIILFIS